MKNDKRLPYIELLPGSPEHKAFISNAITDRDYTKLAALKDRIHLPIHEVSNWFYYVLMMRNVKKQVVVIYTPEDEATLTRLAGSNDKNNS